MLFLIDPLTINIRAGEPELGVFGSLEPELIENQEPELLGKKVNQESELLGKKVRSRSRKKFSRLLSPAIR